MDKRRDRGLFIQERDDDRKNRLRGLRKEQVCVQYHPADPRQTPSAQVRRGS
jgi:hypothetical protein